MYIYLTGGVGDYIISLVLDHVSCDERAGNGDEAEDVNPGRTRSRRVVCVCAVAGNTVVHSWFVCCDQLNSRSSTHALRSLQSCNTSVLTVITHERLLLDFSVFTQDRLWPVRRAPTPNRAFQSARLSCWLSRLRCVDARNGERLCGNRHGFLSNRRGLGSSARASKR